ncbi:MAG: AAA family ATPase [bacterium]|nr:AAA family ATPase [bacterium]
MFLREFGLAVHPFGISPRLDFLYKSGAFEESIAHLVYGLENSEAFIMITGAIGTGKTIAIQSFLSHLGNRYLTALVTNTSVDPKELLKLVLEDLGVPLEAGADKSDLLIAFKKFLIESGRDGKRIIVVIDEAQNLSREALEEVRLLTNLGQGDEQPVQIVLAGQPELEEVLRRADLAQLRQRIRVHYKLAPLTRRELEEYVDHRMVVAGGSAGVFSGRSLDRIYEVSRGIPRVVNTLCGDSLLAAYVAGRFKVEAEDVGETAAGPAPTAADRPAPGPDPVGKATAGTRQAPVAEPNRSPARKGQREARPAANDPAPEMATRQEPRAEGGASAATPKRRASAGRAVGAVVLLAMLAVIGLAATGRLDMLRSVGEDPHLPGMSSRLETPPMAPPQLAPPEPAVEPTRGDAQDTGAPGGSAGVSTPDLAAAGEPGASTPIDTVPVGVDMTATTPTTVAASGQEPAPARDSSAGAPTPRSVPETSDDRAGARAPTDGPFYLHVSSFRTPDHAHSLARQLADSGLMTVVRQQVVRDVVWYRVHIGPFPSHAEAVTRANELREAKTITYYKVMSLEDGDDQ